MTTPSKLVLTIDIRDHAHFEAVNDFIAFYRKQVKTYEWFHTLTKSWVEVEFFHPNDALLFKLKHG